VADEERGGEGRERGRERRAVAVAAGVAVCYCRVCSVLVWLPGSVRWTARGGVSSPTSSPRSSLSFLSLATTWTSSRASRSPLASRLAPRSPPTPKPASTRQSAPRLLLPPSVPSPSLSPAHSAPLTPCTLCSSSSSTKTPTPTPTPCPGAATPPRPRPLLHPRRQPHPPPTPTPTRTTSPSRTRSSSRTTSRYVRPHLPSFSSPFPTLADPTRTPARRPSRPSRSTRPARASSAARTTTTSSCGTLAA